MSRKECRDIYGLINTPTETLVASAYVAHVARRAADYGVRIDAAVNVDMKAVKARKDAVVAVFRDGVE